MSETEINPIQENSWKILTINDAHAYIEDFAKKHEIKLNDPNLRLLMVEEKYSFFLISEQLDCIIQDIIMANKTLCRRR